MKRIVVLFIMCALIMGVDAQNATKARRVLDKTAAMIGRKGGASASFSISGKMANTSGSVAIKGNMFYAHTPQATVWFNGKTQWAYMKNTGEVNVTNPNEAKQAQMNPYKFITIYRNGYNMDMKTSGSSYNVHLTAQNKKRSIQEMYIKINSSTYQPSCVKMRQGNNWTTINISKFRAANQPNSVFSFDAKDYPKAEVIDLR